MLPDSNTLTSNSFLKGRQAICRVTFTLYINIKLLKKWTLEMKKSHFPVLVLKYSTPPLTRFSFNMVFLWPKNRVKGACIKPVRNSKTQDNNVSFF